MEISRKPKVLLHICCGVCALYCIDFLRDAGYAVSGFFSNPNIEPYDEYVKRKLTASQACSIKSVPFIEDSRDNNRWKLFCAGHEEAKEGGARCLLCYEFRLKNVFSFSKNNNYDFFTTTLTISPHKNSVSIFAIGKKLAGKDFLAIDFKKKGGFVKSIQEARSRDMYRQNYCGCLASRR
jgi:epoxyqueuosine reductase